MKIVSKSTLVSAGVTIGIIALLKRFVPGVASQVGL